MNIRNLACAMKLFFWFLLVPQTVWAGDAKCYPMKDFNNKNFCLAVAKKQESYCNLIEKNSMQYLFLAEVTKQKSYCDKITIVDDANNCRKLFRFK